MNQIYQSIALQDLGIKLAAVKEIKIDGTHADVLIVKDEQGQEFVMKIFTGTSRAVKYIGYGKKTHFGRHREANELVFNELQEAGNQYSFLIKHIRRDWIWTPESPVRNWSWVILQEKVEGKDIWKLVCEAINGQNSFEFELIFKLLGKAVKEFHKHGFAHGDPHLGNAVVEFSDNKPANVRLVDYSQLHHPTFYCCKKYECFTTHDRIQEDFVNPLKMGKGFHIEVKEAEEKLHDAGILSEKGTLAKAFKLGYD